MRNRAVPLVPDHRHGNDESEYAAIRGDPLAGDPGVPVRVLLDRLAGDPGRVPLRAVGAVIAVLASSRTASSAAEGRAGHTSTTHSRFDRHRRGERMPGCALSCRTSRVLRPRGWVHVAR